MNSFINAFYEYSTSTSHHVRFPKIFVSLNLLNQSSILFGLAYPEQMQWTYLILFLHAWDTGEWLDMKDRIGKDPLNV